ncbi:MAG: SDR family oxidoreductase [Cyanobacteria bacterium P01_H01_bin.15]
MKALITGASSGIGAAFARALAAEKSDLVLLARSKNKLEALANELVEQFGVQTQVIVQDLTVPNVGEVVEQAVTDGPESVDLLINNAGFGDYGEFCDRPLSKNMEMLQLNITALTDLTGRFLPAMQQRGSGGIINVASIAAFQPLPFMAVYAATKAYVLSFSEALWAENKDKGVNVLALCPGPTESEFFEVAEFPTATKDNFKGPSAVSAEKVVQEALKGLKKQQSNVVTGGVFNQVIVNVPRFSPRDWLVSAVSKQFSPAVLGKGKE